MKKTFVRFSSLLLCLIMFTTMMPLYTVDAAGTIDSNYENKIKNNYKDSFNKSKYWDMMNDETTYAYKDWVNNLDNQNILAKSYRWAVDYMLDKPLNKAAYTDYLIGILAMMDASFVSTAASQAANNASINGKDLIKSGTKVLCSEVLFGRYDSVKFTYEKFSEVAEFGDNVLEEIDDVNKLIVFSTAGALHNQKVTVLETIRDNTTIKSLKDAANDAIDVCNLELSYVLLDYTTDLSTGIVKEKLKDSAVNLMEAINKKVSEGFLPWLESISKKNADSFVTKLLGMGKKLAANTKKIGFGVTIGIELGKILFGETWEKYRESIAMDRISDALILGWEKAKQKADNGGYAEISDYVSIGRALTITHLRGEYCYCNSSVPSDNERAKSHYEAVALNLSDYSATLDEILGESNLKVVHKEFELYDGGFICPVEQKSEVPDGYIGIYSYEDMVASFSVKENDDKEAAALHEEKYILMNDIYVPETHVSFDTFYGIFDGNGYAIHSIPRALFSKLCGATVENLGLFADIHEEEGAVATLATDCDSFYKIDIRDYIYCNVDNCYLYGTIEAGGSTGGFIGGSAIGDVCAVDFANCYSEASITVKSKSKYNHQSLSVGGLAGSCRGVINCYNKGNITIYSENSDSCVGGIASQADFIENSYNSGNINVNVTNGNCEVGGIVYNLGLPYVRVGFYVGPQVINCYNSGNINASATGKNFYGSDYTASAAGIVVDAQDVTNGQDSGDYDYNDGLYEFYYSWGGASIVNCLNNGMVNSGYIAAGIACIAGGTIIHNCINTAKIQGGYLSGGIVSEICSDEPTDSYINFGSIVTNCINIGDVLGSEKVGAIIAYGSYTGYNEEPLSNYDLFVENCYYLDKGVGPYSVSENTECIALSESQMSDKSSFKGFDFGEHWELESDSGYKYPMLRFKPIENIVLIVPKVFVNKKGYRYKTYVWSLALINKEYYKQSYNIYS